MVRKFFVDGSRFLTMGHSLLVKLLAEAKASKDLITLEATVVTGFEFLAMDECKEKCQPVNIFKCKGRIFFNIKKDSYPNVLKMRSLDNVFLVSDAFGNMNFGRVKEQDVEKIASLVPKVDWARNIPEWSELVGFKGIQFPKCANRKPGDPFDDDEPACQNCLKAQNKENVTESQVAQSSSSTEVSNQNPVPEAVEDGSGDAQFATPEVPVGPRASSIKSSSPDQVEIVPVHDSMIESSKDLNAETDDEAFHSAEEDCFESDLKELSSAEIPKAGIMAALEPKLEGTVAVEDPKDGGVDTAQETKVGMNETAQETKDGVIETAQETKDGVIETAQETKVGVIEIDQQTKDRVIETAQDTTVRVIEIAQEAKDGVIETAQETKVGVIEIDRENKDGVIETAQETKVGVFETAQETKVEVIETAQETKVGVTETAEELKNGEIDTAKGTELGVIEAAEELELVEEQKVEEIMTGKEASSRLDEPTPEKKPPMNGQKMRSAPEKTESTSKLFLTGFPTFVKDKDLVLLLEKYGKVVECSVVKNRRNHGGDIAFVHMENEEGAREAIKHLNGQLFSGRPLCVTAAKNRRRPLAAAVEPRNGIEMAGEEGREGETPQAAATEGGNLPQEEGKEGGPPADKKKKKNRWQKMREEKERRAKQKENKRQPKPYVDDGILKFRVTCYRNGPRHSFDSNDAAMHFGGLINDTFHWTVDLTRFDINIFLVIEDGDVYVTFGLTKSSFHRRNISHFGPTTLRATMCYSMVRLAEPKAGEIVIDPLCGGGSISIEGAIGFPKTFHICGDVNAKCMDRTLGNLKFNNKEKTINVDALNWNARGLPLKDQSVDILVSDLPFGLRMGRWKDNVPLYMAVLKELARVVRCGSGRASLLTYDRIAMIKALRATGALWREIRSVSVNQGGLQCVVYLLLRRADTSDPKALAGKEAMLATQETLDEAHPAPDGNELDENQQLDFTSADSLDEAETKSLPDRDSDPADLFEVTDDDYCSGDRNPSNTAKTE